jgi:hypothetical protein
VDYWLDKQFAKFQVDVGVDDEVSNKAAVRFQVWGDGKLLYDSGALSGTDGAKSLDLNVEGILQLKLVTLDPGSDKQPGHGDWAGARLVYDPNV